MNTPISEADIVERLSSRIIDYLIFCVGVNLVWGKTIRVANMLPAVILAVIAAYIPWSLLFSKPQNHSAV